MRILRSFLPFTYPLFLARNVVYGIIKKEIKPDLRVLLYHDIPPEHFDVFSNQLKWLMRRWRFITPSEFEEIINGEKILKQDSLLLTFDDGFISNRLVADHILQPAGIKAIFFVVTDFIDQPNILSARAFIHERLKLGRVSESLPKHYKNMTWSDLSQLLKSGHLIAAHTASHERLIENISYEVMQKEIVAAADRLEAELGIAIRHFAFPFGNFSSFSPQAMAMAAQRFDYIYSGLRGNNSPSPQCYAIRRESQTPTDSKALIGAFLRGASDFHYRRYNEILDQWALNFSYNKK